MARPTDRVVQRSRPPEKRSARTEALEDIAKSLRTIAKALTPDMGPATKPKNHAEPRSRSLVSDWGRRYVTGRKSGMTHEAAREHANRSETHADPGQDTVGALEELRAAQDLEKGLRQQAETARLIEERWPHVVSRVEYSSIPGRFYVQGTYYNFAEAVRAACKEVPK